MTLSNRIEQAAEGSLHRSLAETVEYRNQLLRHIANMPDKVLDRDGAAMWMRDRARSAFSERKWRFRGQWTFDQHLSDISWCVREEYFATASGLCEKYAEILHQRSLEQVAALKARGL